MLTHGIIFKCMCKANQLRFLRKSALEDIINFTKLFGDLPTSDQIKLRLSSLIYRIAIEVYLGHFLVPNSHMD